MGRFGEFLVERGKLKPEGLKKAMDVQQLVGGRLGTNILELDLMREGELLEALGAFRRTPTVTAAELSNVAAEPLRLVPPQIARRHYFVPIERRGNTLVLAARDPVDPLVEDELGYLTSCLVKTKIGLEVRIHQALERYYQILQPARLSGLTRRLDGLASRKGVGSEGPPSPPGKEAGGEGSEAEAGPPAQAATPRPPAAPPRPRRPPAAPRVAPPQPARESEISYIELDSEEVARIYELDSKDKTPQERLAAAADELQKQSIRDEIADVLLEYSRPYLARRILFVRRTDRIVGWRGEGRGVDVGKVRAVEIPAGEPSVFLTLAQGTEFWLGSLMPLPTHRGLIDALGGMTPKDCLVLPVTLRSRLVCFLYGDNREQSVTGVPLAELRRLAAKAGVAFEVSILKNKIRTL